MPLYGETASADTDASHPYMEAEFKKTIKDGQYIPEQVFNMDETCRFWKRMPSRTFFFMYEGHRPGYKVHKDRVTIIMHGNAAGFMMKPGLSYKAKNPRAWLTKALIADWFNHCFVPELKLYLAEKGLPFKILPLMECAGGHATDLQCDEVQIKFLFLNIAALIQPMDQGVIPAFMALYTCVRIEGLIAAVDNDNNDEEGFTLKKYCRKYNIASCFTPDEIHHSAVEKAVALAHTIKDEGFVDMTKEDMNRFIEAHSDPLTDEDLLEMTKLASGEESERAR
ncbi:tigger transposable element-derived protein 1-like [Palaemon carinicauda]|uniref:tigger transposable element-derived protein 1-like n=1 Tax=Palaemon carinicauda TaxID=392227 RepID=UPI0035B6251C